MEHTQTTYDVQRKADNRNAQALQDKAYAISLGIVPGDCIKQEVLVHDTTAVTHTAVNAS